MTSLTLQMKIDIIDTIREEVQDTAYALAEARVGILSGEELDAAFEEIFSNLMKQTLAEIQNEFGGV